MDQLVSFRGASALVYKGAKGKGGAGQEEGAGGVLLLPGVGLPSNPIPTRIGGEGILLPEGVGLSWRALCGRPASPLWSFIY